MSEQILYKDSSVTLTSSYIIIYKYYFPLATSKTIMFSEIQSVEINNTEGVNHRWGVCTKYLNNWFNLDPKRGEKKNFIGIKLKNRNVKPSFTPDEAQKVFQIIWQHHTPQGRQQVERRTSQVGKQTQIAQQQIMQRMKQQQLQAVEKTENQLHVDKK